jgi:hypothetical protein
LPSTDAKVGTLGLDRLKHIINKDRIQERRQGAPLCHTAMHRQRGGEAASKGHLGRASLLEGIDEAPHLTRHAFVSKAVKKGMVHHPVISLTPVEEGQARQFALLHSRSPSSVQGEEGVGGTVPMAESVLVIIELNMRAHPL